MEHISKTLVKLEKQGNIQTPIPSDTGSEGEEEVESDWEKARRFNISTITHTFESFDKVKGAEFVYDSMLSIANGKSDRKFVFLYGTTGNGKTYLLEALIIAWAKQGVWSRYQTNSQIMRRLKAGMNRGSFPRYEEIFTGLCNTDRLIIDDVGMGTVEGSWELTTLEDIINERYHKRYYPSPTITIMATNKDIIDIPDRISSRFFDPEFGVVIRNEADDYRRRKIQK